MAKNKKKSPSQSRYGAAITNAKHHLRRKVSEHRELSPHRTFRMTRKSELPRLRRLPSWWRLSLRALALIRDQLPKIVIMVLIYAPLAWFITGFYAQNFSDFKLALSLFGSGASGFVYSDLEQAFVLFGGFFSSQTEGLARDSLVILNVLTVLFWLAFLWIARHVIARKATSVKQAIYTSGVAFVPFVLVLLTFVIQMLPAVLAVIILSGMTGSGFVQQPAEIALLAALAILLIVLSLYFVTSTLVALQIAALPGMQPWAALKNARKLVMGRRLAVLRKLLMLLVIVLLGWLLLFAPALVADNALCGDENTCWSTTFVLPLYFYLLCGAALAFVSIYMYMLYRALLDADDGVAGE